MLGCAGIDFRLCSYAILCDFGCRLGSLLNPLGTTDGGIGELVLDRCKSRFRDTKTFILKWFWVQFPEDFGCPFEGFRLQLDRLFLSYA